MSEATGAPLPWQELVVQETASAFVVASAGDPDDWIVSFEKVDGFPAREWAERMAWLYNAGGIEGQSVLAIRRTLSSPPPFCGYAPEGTDI